MLTKSTKRDKAFLWGVLALEGIAVAIALSMYLSKYINPILSIAIAIATSAVSVEFWFLTAKSQNIVALFIACILQGIQTVVACYVVTQVVKDPVMATFLAFATLAGMLTIRPKVTARITAIYK